jgi:mRNA interferase MazF
MKNGKSSMQKIDRFAVYWFNPEPATGAELRKIRPCVVISSDEMNEQVRTVLVAPLTSTIKSWPFRTNVIIDGHKSSVACDQIRVVDKTRLKSYITDLSLSESRAVLQVCREIFVE